MLQRVPGLSTFVLLNTVLLYGLIPFHLPTHPPVDMFLLGAITNNALETPMCKFLHKPMFPFLKVNLGVKWLGYVVNLLEKHSEKVPDCFPKQHFTFPSAPFYIPTSNIRGSDFFTS